MSTIAVGLFPVDVELMYISKEVAIVLSPGTHKPTLVVRQALTHRDQIKAVNLALRTAEMKFVGEPFFREDGLWCCEVEATNGKENHNSNNGRT